MVIAGRSFWNRTWCFFRIHILVCPVWSTLGKSRSRQLFHQSRICTAWPLSWGPCQGSSGFFRNEWHDLGFLHRKCCDHRHIHHPFDETRGFQSRKGRCGGSGSLNQWTVDASDYGSCRIFNDRICGNLLPGSDQTCLSARSDFIHCTGLYRPS